MRSAERGEPACGGEQRSWKRYGVEFGAAMALYTISVPATVMITERYQPEGGAALAVAMIPVIPTMLAFWAFMRQFWRVDELQRRVVSEAVVVAAAVVGFGSFAIGWVAAVADWRVETGALIWVLPALILAWGAAMFFVKRRYS